MEDSEWVDYDEKVRSAPSWSYVHSTCSLGGPTGVDHGDRESMVACMNDTVYIVIHPVGYIVSTSVTSRIK